MKAATNCDSRAKQWKNDRMGKSLTCLFSVLICESPTPRAVGQGRQDSPAASREYEHLDELVLNNRLLGSETLQHGALKPYETMTWRYLDVGRLLQWLWAPCLFLAGTSSGDARDHGAVGAEARVAMIPEGGAIRCVSRMQALEGGVVSNHTKLPGFQR